MAKTLDELALAYATASVTDRLDYAGTTSAHELIAAARSQRAARMRAKTDARRGMGTLSAASEIVLEDVLLGADVVSRESVADVLRDLRAHMEADGRPYPRALVDRLDAALGTGASSGAPCETCGGDGFVGHETNGPAGWQTDGPCPTCRPQAQHDVARLCAQNAELEWRVKDAHRELTNARRNRLVVDGTVERLTSNLDLSRTRVDELERWLAGRDDELRASRDALGAAQKEIQRLQVARIGDSETIGRLMSERDELSADVLRLIHKINELVTAGFGRTRDDEDEPGAVVGDGPPVDLARDTLVSPLVRSEPITAFGEIVAGADADVVGTLRRDWTSYAAAVDSGSIADISDGSDPATWTIADDVEWFKGEAARLRSEGKTRIAAEIATRIGRIDDALARANGEGRLAARPPVPSAPQWLRDYVERSVWPTGKTFAAVARELLDAWDAAADHETIVDINLRASAPRGTARGE